MWCDSFPQVLVGQNPGLGESPHCLPDFQEDKSIPGMDIQIVLLFTHSGNNTKGTFMYSEYFKAAVGYFFF
jgi:hypothetical protein